MYRENGSAIVITPELVDLLTATQRWLARDLGAFLEEEGTTLDQWRILRSLTIDGGRSMGELAASLEIPNPTLTRLSTRSLTPRTCTAPNQAKIGGEYRFTCQTVANSSSTGLRRWPPHTRPRCRTG